MIQTVIDSVKPKITNLSFVETYGGLVFPVSIHQQIMDSGRAIKSTKIIPVTCGMDGQDCFNKGSYRKLYPDNMKKSVVYFEEVQPLTFLKNEGAKNSIMVFAGRVRLVFFLNLQLLGHLDGCGISQYVIIETIKALCEPCQLISPLRGSVSFSQFTTTRKGENVFSKYSDNQGAKYILKPYESFAIDMKIEVKIGKNCTDDFVLGEPIDCIDLTQI